MELVKTSYEKIQAQSVENLKPLKTSYKDPNEVIVLLKDMTDTVKPVSKQERANRVAQGDYVRSVIIEDEELNDEYINIVKDNMHKYLESMAEYVGIVAEQILEARGKNVVLADIARAGLPIGILIRRYLKQFHNIEVPHYSMSLVEGLDPCAIKYMAENHGIENIQFVDGWTGKGSVTFEIEDSALNEFEGLDPSLAVLVDSIGAAKYAGCREDRFIPHSPLNTATGLISITVWNPNYTNQDIGEFHAACYLSNLEDKDISQWYVDEVSKHFKKCGTEEYKPNNNDVIDHTFIDKYLADLGIDKKAVNPGINESARAILRRPLVQVRVQSIEDCKDSNEIGVLLELCKIKNIPIVEDKNLHGYKIITVANDGYIR